MPTPIGDAWQDIWADVWADVWVSSGGAPDTEAPVGVITSPANGSSASGSINIVGVFVDNVGVTDGRLISDGVTGSYTSQSGGNFTIAVNTTLFPDGAHTFQIDAIDAAGNHGLSQVVTLHIMNAAVGSGGGQRGILQGAAGGVSYAPKTRAVKVIQDVPPKKKKAATEEDMTAAAAPEVAPAVAPAPRRSALLSMRSGG